MTESELKEIRERAEESTHSRSDILRLLDVVEYFRNEFLFYQAECDKQDEEIERLRDALEDIAHTCYGGEATPVWIEKKARQALGEAE